MRFIIYISAVVALAAAPAHAGVYEARCTKLADWVKNEPGITSPDDRKKLEATLAQYCPKRNECLDLVAAALRYAKPDAKLEGSWAGCVSSPPIDLLNTGFSGLSEELKRSPVWASLMKIAGEEAAFFAQLNGALAQVARSRDPVAADKLTVEDTTKKLSSEWAAVKSNADVFGQGVKRLCSDSGFYRSMRAELRPAVEKAKDVITEAVKAFANIFVDGWPAEGDALVDTARTEIERLALKAAAVRQASSERRAANEALSGLRGVQRVYLDLRSRADDFLRSYKGRESAVNAGIDALQNLSRNVSAPGQPEDAGMLYTVTFSSLVQLRDDYVRAMDAYTAQHAEALKTTREAVSRQAEWSCIVSKIRNESLRGELYTWRRSVANYFDVDLSRLGKWRDRFQSALRSSIDAGAQSLDREKEEEDADESMAQEGASFSSRVD